MNITMSHEVLQRIREYLIELDISFREVEHAPTRTSLATPLS